MYILVYIQAFFNFLRFQLMLATAPTSYKMFQIFCSYTSRIKGQQEFAGWKLYTARKVVLATLLSFFLPYVETLELTHFL